MQIDFLTVLIAVLSLVLLAVPGFIFGKLKLFPENAAETFSTFVLYCAQSAMLFMSFQEYYNDKIASNILIVAGLTVVIHLAMFAVIYLVMHHKGKRPTVNSARYASMFSNCGYMGLPFLQIVFSGSGLGGEIIIYAGIVIAIFNVFSWTLGVYLVSGDKKYVSLKKIALNPVIISIVLGALCFFIIKKPIANLATAGTSGSFVLEKIMGSIDIIGNLVTPLSMTVIGINLAKVKVKELLLDKWAYVSCFFKLIVMSVLTMFIVAFLPIDNVVKYLMFFLLSMPSATSTAMFSVKFGGDVKSASVTVLLSTVLSILTIPLLYLLMSGVFVAL